MSPSTPKPTNPAHVRVHRGLTLVEIILGLTVGALLVFSAFVSFQHIFTKTREHAELAALKSVAREAQALLAMSGADRWDTQAGLDAVMGALEDWPSTQAASVVGVVADDSGIVVTEADVWPEMSDLTFSRSPNTLLMVVALDDGACVVTAPPHTGTLQGGCVSNLDAIGESSPSEAVTNQQIPGINNTATQPEQPTTTEPEPPTTTTTEPPTTTTTAEPEPEPGFWAQTAAGSSHSCALTATGDAYCWGNGANGQLGNGNTTSQTTPVKVVGNHSFVSISAGNNYSCGVTTGGDAYCWGRNNFGQLGNGNISIYGGVVSPAKVSGKHTFVSITAGDNHTCGVTTGGDAYCWGYNYYSQVGTWTAGVERSAPIKVPGNHSFMSITAGGNHTCGVTTDGDAYCWGNNTYGQVGNGTTNQETAPGKVIGNHSFMSITAGGNHTCGVTTDGDAYCWGSGGNGRLGNGNTSDQTTPVKASGNHSFKTITANAWHSCGVTTNGDAYCWGSGGNGRLGNGNTSDQTTPVKVTGNLRFQSITGRYSHSCALTTDGDAYCWGSNYDGRLGNGNTINQLTPVLVVEP